MTDTSRNDGFPLRGPADVDGSAEADESLPKRELQKLLGGCCRDCSARYSAREAVFNIFLGLKDAPRCLSCTSRHLERPVEDLRSDLLACIQRRDCYLQAWRQAERLDGVGSSSSTPPRAESVPAVDGNEYPVAAAWDAGDMGCGELVMELRIRMGKLRAGEVLRVTARDRAAPEDLPAWCRLCGHALLAMNHPHYWIRRKGD